MNLKFWKKTTPVPTPESAPDFVVEPLHSKELKFEGTIKTIRDPQGKMWVDPMNLSVQFLSLAGQMIGHEQDYRPTDVAFLASDVLWGLTDPSGEPEAIWSNIQHDWVDPDVAWAELDEFNLFWDDMYDALEDEDLPRLRALLTEPTVFDEKPLSAAEVFAAPLGEEDRSWIGPLF